MTDDADDAGGVGVGGGGVTIGVSGGVSGLWDMPDV